jgi:hypothetical protein
MLLTDWTNFGNLIEGTTTGGTQSRRDEEWNEAVRFVILITGMCAEEEKRIAASVKETPAHIIDPDNKKRSIHHNLYIYLYCFGQSSASQLEFLVRIQNSQLHKSHHCRLLHTGMRLQRQTAISVTRVQHQTTPTSFEQ